MKFLCLCHYDADAFTRLGPADFDEIGRICAPHDKALRDSGRLTLVGSLGLPEHSVTLRADGSQITAAPGPYAQTREPFGAFFIVEAESIDEAVEIARLHPGTHLGAQFGGGIEVRPIEQLDLLHAERSR